METKIIQVRLFGAFREFAPSGVFPLPVRGDESIAELKAALSAELTRTMAISKTASKFDIAALIAKSALATDSKVLNDNDFFNGSELAILPPVCGG